MATRYCEYPIIIIIKIQIKSISSIFEKKLPVTVIFFFLDYFLAIS